MVPYSSRVFISIPSIDYCLCGTLRGLFVVSMASSHSDRWISNAKLPLGVNECVHNAL